MFPDGPKKLVEPPQLGIAVQAIELCEQIIEEGIDDVLSVLDGRSVSKPSFRGAEYDEGYAQGRKDACRVILFALSGREHITSEDVLERREQG